MEHIGDHRKSICWKKELQVHKSQHRYIFSVEITNDENSSIPTSADLTKLIFPSYMYVYVLLLWSRTYFTKKIPKNLEKKSNSFQFYPYLAWKKFTIFQRTIIKIRDEKISLVESTCPWRLVEKTFYFGTWLKFWKLMISTLKTLPYQLLWTPLSWLFHHVVLW